MHSASMLGIFLLLAVASLLWGRTLWYCSERSALLRRWLFFLMGFTRRPMLEVRSLLLTAIYGGTGLLLALVFAVSFGLPVSRLITPISQSHFALAVLGAAGEISLTNLLVDLICRLPGVGGPQRLAEMSEVPWIKGVRQLPALAAPLAAALGGVSEEIFFRGVMLRILTDRWLAPPVVAIVIAGILFCVQQVVQVQTRFQAVVIGCGCVAISAVGGILVVLSGSVVPAVFAHASFVLFFMTQGGEASASLRQRGMASR
jgi:membrane protease YdiL (CAAX protease family)